MEYDVVFGPVFDISKREWMRFLLTEDKRLYIETAEIDESTGVVTWTKPNVVPSRHNGHQWFVYDPFLKRTFQLRRNKLKILNHRYSEYNSQLYLRETVIHHVGKQKSEKHRLNLMHRLGRYGQRTKIFNALEFHQGREIAQLEKAPGGKLVAIPGQFALEQTVDRYDLAQKSLVACEEELSNGEEFSSREIVAMQNWSLIGKRRHISHDMANMFIALATENNKLSKDIKESLGDLLDFFWKHLAAIKECTDSQIEYCAALRYLMTYSIDALKELNPKTLSRVIVFQREYNDFHLGDREVSISENEKSIIYSVFQYSLKDELCEYVSPSESDISIVEQGYNQALLVRLNSNYRQALLKTALDCFDVINPKKEQRKIIRIRIRKKPAKIENLIDKNRAIATLIDIYKNPNCWNALSFPAQAKLLFTLKQANDSSEDNAQLSALISKCPLNLETNEHCTEELTLLIKGSEKKLKLKEVAKLSQSKNELVWWAIVREPSLREQLVKQSTMLDLMHQYPSVAELCVNDKSILKKYGIKRVELIRGCTEKTHVRAAQQLYQMYREPLKEAPIKTQEYDYDRYSCLNDFEQLAVSHVELAIQMIEEDSPWLQKENIDALLAELVEHNEDNPEAISHLVNALYDNPRLKPKSLQFIDLCQKHVDDPNIFDDLFEIIAWFISFIYNPKEKMAEPDPVPRQVSFSV